MLSFETLYKDTQEEVQDSDTTSLRLIKKWINTGAKKFGAILNREWRNSIKTFSTVANQQYYPMPQDAIRIKNVTVTIASVKYPLTLIEDEESWNILNMRVQTSSIPEYFYVRGSDEFGMFPIPSASVASAGSINYERRMRDMSADDYKTGTIQVVAGTADVVGTGTTFTALMVGRSLKINDPSGDGMWYKISAFTDTTHITLDTVYAGASATGLSYVIGELPDIPEEFHEACEDYACMRYYLRRKDKESAADFKLLFDEALNECKAQYSSKTSSQYVRGNKLRRGYIHQQPTQGIQ